MKLWCKLFVISLIVAGLFAVTICSDIHSGSVNCPTDSVKSQVPCVVDTLGTEAVNEYDMKQCILKSDSAYVERYTDSVADRDMMPQEDADVMKHEMLKALMSSQSINQ